jgi:hypothetical protein
MRRTPDRWAPKEAIIYKLAVGRGGVSPSALADEQEQHTDESGQSGGKLLTFSSASRDAEVNGIDILVLLTIAIVKVVLFAHAAACVRFTPLVLSR